MSGVSLPDAEARRVVTRDLERTLFVEAGAGSGKTRSLVERIVALVDSGERIEQVAAITFTEAAAAELRTRVRDALEARSSFDATGRIADALANIEVAAITTLHGFALRLLLEHPVEAGLPPGFSVADEVSSLVAFDRAWRVFTGRIGDDLDLLDLQAMASVLGLHVRSFKQVARRFDDNWDLLDGVDLHPPAPDTRWVEPMLDRLAGLIGLLDDCVSRDDPLATAIVDLVDHIEQIRGMDELGRVERLRSLAFPARRSGRKGNWRRDIDAVRAELAMAGAELRAALDGLTDAVLQHLLVLVAGFVAERTEARRRDGALSFHDLLVLARRLLRRDESVRRRIHQQYRRLLLDEFQDTDPIQIELAVLLASASPPGERPWTELAADLPPGRLVVVGDPKQSIYRFRRADIGVYADAERTLVERTTRLTTNFRSVPGIVDFVNLLFGEAIGEGVPGAQPAYTPLGSHRMSDPSSGPPVTVIGGPHTRQTTAEEIRSLEAADVAAVICTALEQQWPVFRDGQWRPPRLSDIAVLLPSRLALPSLESAMGAAGLPFRPETSSLVYATQEVRDVMAGVRAVVDPTSAIDVVAALRSALFAVTDEHLLTWHLGGGGWDYRVIPDTGDGADRDIATEGREHPVAAAFAVLRSWHDDRWWLEPSAFVERVVRERRLREQTLAKDRPRDHWRRYRFLTEQAREFTATAGGDLHDFVAWVEIQAGDSARISEPIPAESDDDAVRVLTIHGSKGLEFPITVLAGASTRDRRVAAGPVVLFPPGEAPQVRLRSDSATADYDAHASVEELLDANERVRLHYVAATRARDRLVVSAHHKEGEVSMGHRVHLVLDRSGPPAFPAPLVQRFEAVGTERYRARPPTQLRLAPGDFDAETRIWSVEQAALIDAAERSRTWSPTAIAAHLGRIEGAPGHEPGPWRRGRAGTAIGSAVHAVLQHVDLPAGDTVGELARLHARREGIAELSGRVAALAGAAVASPLVQRASARRHWRELSVAAPVGEGLLEGYVDLLFEDDDGLVVVDFKTDPVRDEADADRLVAGYRTQGAAYVLAVSLITGRPVVACRFLFLAADGVIERSVVDLDDAVEEVRRYLLCP